MHALDGDPGPALEALQRAIELNPESRNWAAAMKPSRGSAEPRSSTS
jgi:hypothetical protein